MFRRPSTPSTFRRRAAAAVELAVVMPVFVGITFLAIESGHSLNMAQKLETAVRSGGRLAAKDVDTALLGSQTANEKVVTDIKNMLKADGFPVASVTVTITHADGPTAGQTFDLSLATNQYKLMRISASIPYSAISMFPLGTSPGNTIGATLVQSRGRSTLNN